MDKLFEDVFGKFKIREQQWLPEGSLIAAKGLWPCNGGDFHHICLCIPIFIAMIFEPTWMLQKLVTKVTLEI